MTTSSKELLRQQLEEITAKKLSALKANQYELAALLRDQEKALIDKIQHFPD